MTSANLRWYQHLTRYHWFVLLVAALGWLFDCLDQQLFILARPAVMEELIPANENTTPEQLKAARTDAGNIATSVFIAGWACGGLIFGMLGDRIGRAKTMMITILLYSLFTGLSSLSTGQLDFCLFRFITGLGIGGEFAVGVALVAETMPAAARPYCLAMLQALSAIGNVLAALINMGLGLAAEQGLAWSPWRIMFLIGALPALLALVIRRRLKEPEQWTATSHDGAVQKKLGSYRELFADPTLRRHALLGLMLACAGVIGLWSIGFFTPDLIRAVRQRPVTLEYYQGQLAAAQQTGETNQASLLQEIIAQVEDPQHAAPLSDAAAQVKSQSQPRINSLLTRWQSFVSIAMNCGAFLGMFGFGFVSQRLGRKPTFALALMAAFVSTLIVFWSLSEFWHLWVLVPLMGFCQLSLFAGYAIYFPELFPTRLRSTGTSFCYNVGRFVAASGPLLKSKLEEVFSTASEPMRAAGMAMCLIFLIGLLALPFLPETRWKALPE